MPALLSSLGTGRGAGTAAVHPYIRFAGAPCRTREDILACVDATALRAEFPVLAAIAYLNAGTDGPLPARAAAAAAAELERELAEGRAQAHFERRNELATQLRERLRARLLGCEAADVALTTCTTEGHGPRDRRPGARRRR